MGYSFSDEVGDGVKVAFPFAFTGPDNGYWTLDQLIVTVDEVVVAFTLTGPTQVTLAVTPVIGAKVRIKRDPDFASPYADFSRGSDFTQTNMNRSFQSQLYNIHNIIDGFKSESYYEKQALNVGGFSIFNLANGVNAQDAVTLGQLDEALAAAEINAAQTHTEVVAVAKTVFELSFSIPAFPITSTLYADGVLQYDAFPCDISGVLVTTGTTKYVNAGSELPVGVAVKIFSFTHNGLPDILDQLEEAQQIIADWTLPFDTKAQMSASTTLVAGQKYETLGRSAIGDGGDGEFLLLAGNYTAEVAADPLGGVYVPLDSDPTGASSCLVRQGELKISHFGSVTGGGDDTAVVAAFNVHSKKVVFEQGKTYSLLNWEPLAGTVIIAKGATLLYETHTLFGTTTSSGSLIITNDDIQIYGGKWTASITDIWSASIILNGGSDFSIDHAEITQSWGGISGHETQNGVLQSEGVSITNCHIHDCSHNTYLSDIDGLIFVGNISEASSRDGLRTYRNVQNIIITDNIIRNNGNGDPAVSQDGIDLFIEGTRCIITDNHIYGNVTSGIDIKQNDSEAIVEGDKEYIISGNFIYDNDDDGISVEDNTAAQLGIDTVAVEGANHIYNNAGYGVHMINGNSPKVSGNFVYGNGKAGVRLEDCTDLDINRNTVNNNGTLEGSGQRIGILVVNGSGGIITGNIVRPNGAHQTEGIVVTGAVYLKDNDSSGHATSQIKGDTLTLGKKLSFGIVNDTTLHLIMVVDFPAFIARAGVLVNNTITSMQVLVSKRNLSTGSFSGTLVTAAGFANGTAYSFKDLGAITAAEALIHSNEVITVQLSSITSSFTEGILQLEYCD